MTCIPTHLGFRYPGLSKLVRRSLSFTKNWETELKSNGRIKDLGKTFFRLYRLFYWKPEVDEYYPSFPALAFDFEMGNWMVERDWESKWEIESKSVWERGRVSECVCEKERESMLVSDRKRERETGSEWERERESGSGSERKNVCACFRLREGDRACSVSVCEGEKERKCVCRNKREREWLDHNDGIDFSAPLILWQQKQCLALIQLPDTKSQIEEKKSWNDGIFDFRRKRQTLTISFWLGGKLAWRCCSSKL